MADNIPAPGQIDTIRPTAKERFSNWKEAHPFATECAKNVIYGAIGAVSYIAVISAAVALSSNEEETDSESDE